MRTDWRVHAVLLFVQATFGAFHVVAKSVIGVVPPLALAGLRVAIATPLLLLVAAAVDRVVPARRDWWLLGALGALGIFANQVLYILGLQLTTATAAGILMPSTPVFTAALAAVFGIERLTGRSVAGIALAVAGAVVILDPRRVHLADHGGLGDLLILVNCLLFACYLVLQRSLLRRLPPLTLVAWAFLFGGTATLAVSAPALARTDFARVPASAWVGIAFIVLVATVTNYALNAWALRRSSPALVATYTTLQPLFAATLAAAFLGEQLGGRELAGFALIASGLVAVSLRTAPAPVRRDD